MYLLCSMIFMCSRILNKLILVNTFYLILQIHLITNMENKKLDYRHVRQYLLDVMRNEIAQLGIEQREQKKTRKLANRPEGKSLQSIVDEISERRDKITYLILLYRWIRHGKKYWANRGVYSWEEYFWRKPESNTYHWKHRNDPGYLSHAKEYFVDQYEYYLDLAHDNMLARENKEIYGDYFNEYMDEIILWENQENK